MNANELIEYMKTHDYCEGDVKNLFELVDQQQSEIFHQQAEIEALKVNQCKHESWKKRSDRMTVQCNKCGLEADELSRTYKVYIDITDEEIDELADKFGAGMEQFGGCFRHLDFARAILLKAQDK